MATGSYRSTSWARLMPRAVLRGVTDALTLRKAVRSLTATRESRAAFVTRDFLVPRILRLQCPGDSRGHRPLAGRQLPRPRPRAAPVLPAAVDGLHGGGR